MPEQHNATGPFWQAYNALPPDVQRRAYKQFALLKANPQHPSLQLKKLADKHGEAWWSARVSEDYRALAIKQPGGFFWFWIGNHKTYDSLIA